MKKVLMVGPDLGVRGGTPSVEIVLLNKIRNTEQVTIDFIPAHRDLSKIGKLVFAGINYCRYFVCLVIKKIDVVYIHMSAHASFFRKSLFIITGKIFQKKIVVHMHGGYFQRFYDDSSPVIKKYIRFIVGLADEIIVLTGEWKKFYLSLTNKNTINVIHNSVDVDLNKYNSEGTMITFLGRLNQKKGTYDILEVAGDIIREYPDIRFVLAGDGEVEKTRQKVAEKGLQDNFEIPGWVSKEKVEEYLAETVLFLLPSYYEGLSMAVLEAMSYGIPVISTDAGGLHEVITSGENGILITPGNLAELKNNLLRLLRDKELREKFSREGHATIKEQFNSDLFAQRVTSILLR